MLCKKLTNEIIGKRREVIPELSGKNDRIILRALPLYQIRFGLGCSCATMCYGFIELSFERSSIDRRLWNHG
jgi:hypothetical protein